MKVDGNGKALVLSSEQLDQLLDAAPTAQHRAVWAVQRWTAARVSEALSLQWRAVSGGKVTFKRRNTKTKATRQVEMSKRLSAELETYRKEWALRWGREPEPKDLVFPGRYGTAEAMTRQTADHALRKTLRSLGIEGASTHSFRRSLATNALARGCSLRAIQEVTGHKTLSGLGNYLDVNDDEVRAVIGD